MSNLPTPINLNDTTPESPNGEVLVKWQGDNANPRNVSAYVPFSSPTQAGAMFNRGDIGGTGENPTVEGLLGIEITEAPTADGQVLQFVADGVSDAGVAFGSLKFAAVSPAGLSIDIQTDGVSNSDQTTLNLISGTGVTLTPDGSGGVTIDSTGGDATSFNGDPLDLVTPPADGNVWQWSSTTSKYELVTDRPQWPVISYPGRPSAGQIFTYPIPAGIIFPANFSTPNSYGYCAVNPAVSAVFTVYKYSSGVTTTVGTVTISTSGVFTFASAGGTSVIFNAGDVMLVVAPGSQDANLANLGIVLVGQRSQTLAAGTPVPILFNAGTYVGGTPYFPYQFVYYTPTGSTYICILATSGTHDPTNATYWQPMALAGTGSVNPVDVQTQAYVWCGTAGGSANALALSPSPALGAYGAGTSFEFKASADNTTAVTANISGLGTRAIVDTSGAALAAGALKNGCNYRVTDNGTALQLMGGGGSSLTVVTTDGSVSVASVNTIKFANGTLKDLGSGVVSADPGAVGTPYSVGGLFMWCAADKLTGYSDGDSVFNWKSFAYPPGGGPELSAHYSSVCPVYKTNIVNSKPIVRFSGTGWFQGAGPFDAFSWSVFLVMKMSSLSPSYTGVLGFNVGADSGGYFVKSNGKTALYPGSASNYDGSGAFTFGTTTFVVVSLIYTGQSFATRAALATDGSVGSLQNTNPALPRLFFLGNQNVSSRVFTGDIAEFLLYDCNVGTTNRDTIENYLKTKYGL
jgi:hypothetical protein